MSNPNPASGGPPLRALAMVLIALAIVFAGLGAMSLSSADSDDSDAAAPGTSNATVAKQVPAGTTAAPTSAAAPTGNGSPSKTSASATTTGPSTTSVAHSVPVRVLNNSMVVGLAAKTAGELTDNGWMISETGNYSGTNNIPSTTVFYGNSPGDKEAAQNIADELGATTAPKSSTIGDSSPGVTVIVTGN